MVMRKFGIIICTVLLAGAFGGCSDDDGDPICGDGVREGTEECDDANAIDDDECANDCMLNGVCGDGTTDPGEECDDGNTVDDDACSNDCNITPICGDNLINGDDLCDGTALGVATCSSLGFSGGTLACDTDCQSLDTTDCTAGPSNDTCATADQIVMDSITSEAIETPGDRDFFEFTGVAGSWINISTEANPDDIPEMVDTVIRIYDADCALIAENDDSVPRVNTDSQLLMRLPADGTYFVEVLEFTDWYDEPLEGEPSFIYDLSVNILPSNDNLLLDPETGDGTSSTTALPSNADDYWIVYGMFRDNTDVDVFTLNLPAGPPASGGFYLDFMPTGIEGNGSTAEIGLVYITDMTDATVYAQVDPSDGFVDLTMINTAGNYLLWVEHSGATAGTNDFYSMKARVAGTNPVETDSTANEAVAGAQALDVQLNGDVSSGFILSWIDASDTDHYSFNAATGDTVTVVCGSSSSGTGLVGLTVALLNSAETVVSTDTEQPGPDGALIEDQPIVTGGMHYIRLTATGQDSVIVSNHVQCGVHITPAP
jgi:cysteine-rich repeat protein